MIARCLWVSLLSIVCAVAVATGHDGEKAARDVQPQDVDRPVPSGGRYCFISHGCWGGYTRAKQRGVAALMGQLAATNDIRFVIAAGDNFYKKGVRSAEDKLWKDVFEDVYTAPALQVPWVVGLGNHDYRGDFWAQVKYGETHPRWRMPHPYHAQRFPAASAIVIVLDTPLLERCAVNPPGSPRCWDKGKQKAWLEAELRSASKDGLKWKIIVGHYPMYANGPHVNHQWLIDLVEPLMARYNAQLYINADNHYLQVSKKDGRYFLNSGGGGGYNDHKATDRGYHRNQHNVFIDFSMGPAVHCIDPADDTMTTEVWSVRSPKQPLHTFTQHATDGRPVAPAGARRTPVPGATEADDKERDADKSPVIPKPGEQSLHPDAGRPNVGDLDESSFGSVVWAVAVTVAIAAVVLWFKSRGKRRLVRSPSPRV